jgi:hypothetical protein
MTNKLSSCGSPKRPTVECAWCFVDLISLRSMLRLIGQLSSKFDLDKRTGGRQSVPHLTAECEGEGTNVQGEASLVNEGNAFSFGSNGVGGSAWGPWGSRASVLSTLEDWRFVTADSAQRIVELKPGGSEIQVTPETATECADLLCWHR